MTRHSHLLLAFAALLTACAGARAAEENLADLDLATLMTMDVTVTSAAKRAQTTADAAAAVFVITREDIRRSGATSIPDLLRVVPGVQVARVTTRSWAVSARGFNSKFANKLQVMIDGRSIYATIFSGVLWEEQFVPLDEIDRIEVVRGPGGALWGINAVNGVINIITRSASEDRGLHMSAGAGTQVSEAASMRYGASLAGGDLRAYADHSDADAFEGDPTDLDRSQLGLRFERSFERDHLAFDAQYSDVEFGDSVHQSDAALPASAHLGNIGAGWRRDHVNGSQTELRTNYSWADRGQPGRWDETIAGVDVQHTAARTGRHLATVGAGFRHVTDDQRSENAALFFSRTSLDHDQWSVYAQDEIHFLQDRLRVIAGAKLEDFKYTGLAFQPTLRAIWRASDGHTFWSAASRAARTPSRFELHSAVSVPLPGPGVPTSLRILGSEELEAEQLDAYEIGWRWRPNQQFALDLALFLDEYDKLLVQTPQAPLFAPGPPPQMTLPLQYANDAEASAHGAELSVEWLAMERVRLRAAAQWLDMDLPMIANSLNAFGAEADYSWSMGARVDIAPTLDLDITLRAVAALESQGIDSYESFDVRLGWRPTRELELSLAVENLLDDEHVEFFNEIAQTPGVALGRSAFARAAWRWGR